MKTLNSTRVLAVISGISHSFTSITKKPTSGSGKLLFLLQKWTPVCAFTTGEQIGSKNVYGSNGRVSFAKLISGL